MPLYFGLPLNLDEIIRLLNLSSCIDDALNLFTKQPKNYEIIHVKYYQIRKFIKMHTELDLFATDKGQYILGYEIKQISDVWNNFTNYDEFIEILKNFKQKFDEDILTLNIDLFHVELERMENDEMYVNYPQPCVIQWNHN